MVIKSRRMNDTHDIVGAYKILVGKIEGTECNIQA
jgi:hypothetical protein